MTIILMLPAYDTALVIKLLETGSYYLYPTTGMGERQNPTHFLHSTQFLPDDPGFKMESNAARMKDPSAFFLQWPVA